MYPVALGQFPEASPHIVIKQIANAWMVILPNMRHFAPPVPFDQDEYLRKQMIIAKETFQGGDDILDKIRREQEQKNAPEIPKTPPLPKISDLKEENVFCFTTFPELLTFLADTVK